jgi:hypothetical protein
MGEGANRIAASTRGSESNGLGSPQACDVGVSPAQDRGGAESRVGEVVGAAEEGGIEYRM